MHWIKSKTLAIAIACLAVIGQGYEIIVMRTALRERIGSLEGQIESVRATDGAKITQLSSDLTAITTKIGVTTEELQHARSLAEQLKQENARTAQRLQKELAAKADSQAVSRFRDEATNKLAEVQQDATTKIGAVSGEVAVVRTGLDAARQELAANISDVKSQIARNGSELAELRRRGERDYFEFDMRKTKQFERIADVRVQLTKTDVKRQKFNVVIQADDDKIEKKDRGANEPVQFLVGRDRLRYELVVNYVDKDRIRGYLSTPKDKVLSAEGPVLRTPASH
jgi:chromosome segregation ATPase